ncbi:metallophosphoesterase [Terrilactibacillus sp. S3-3]|nr:metallophosphoesterase [Terrilactibacillus sp. S3-3]
MKVLIVSDTHGLKQELTLLKHRYEDEVGVFIHCGDSELSPDAPEMTGFIAVEGNCDIHSAYPDTLLKAVGPVKFLVTHGHLFDVKRSPMKLMYKGLESGASVVCFGHTHVAQTFQEGGIIFINPGSLRLPRNHQEGTYAVCDFEQDRLRVAYYNFAGEQVDSLSRTFLLNR